MIDILFAAHFVFILLLLSIPLWAEYWLKYAIYTPLVLSAAWIIFDGCPLTKLQDNLGEGKFVQYLIGGISSEQSVRISNFTLLLITVLSMWRLCPKIIPW